MEPEQNKVESAIAPLKKVTPLSKYFAMGLFIILPFVGGWIGYVYAPEKLVEVETTIISDAAKTESNPQEDVSEDYDLQPIEAINGGIFDNAPGVAVFLESKIPASKAFYGYQFTYLFSHNEYILFRATDAQTSHLISYDVKKDEWSSVEIPKLDWTLTYLHHNVSYPDKEVKLIVLRESQQL
jgi:hypothetical protein